MPQSPKAQIHGNHPFHEPKMQFFSSDAAKYLRQRTSQILETWVTLARQQATLAQASSDASFLRDSLPPLLTNLADALEDPRWQYGTARNNDIARAHGQQRHGAHIYTLPQMVDEYAILRHVICKTMQREEPWPSEIIARIHAFIDAAISAAANEFAHLEKKGEVQVVAQQRDASYRREEETQSQLHAAKSQRDDAHAERDVGREDIAALLQEKQVRERVVALLSHDLRSPLSSIVINAQRLARKPDDAALASTVAPRVISAANRIDDMIQDMLDASRLRAGCSMPVHLATCDMVRVARDARDDLVQTLAARVKFLCPRHAGGLWDAKALRRVIDNLLGNAFKYGTPKSDVALEVVDLGADVRVAVRNQGNPLSEDEISSLFDPYVRTKAAETGKQRGWGLGLTLVRGVVEAHSGRFGVTSSADDGTTFWFELPKALPTTP